MKKILLIFFLIFSWSAQAQVNLVLNPSFERYDTCPDYFNQIYRATYWSSIDTIDNPFIASSPQYANTCATTATERLPNNSEFHHYPRTGNGLAYAEMYFDRPSVSYAGPQREYTQGRLSTNLTSGQSYCVTFYVALATYGAYASNNIGAYFDNGAIDSLTGAILSGHPHYADSMCGQPQTQYTPQVVESQIILDSINWTKVQGSFIANGTERFITIGNFSDRAHTSAQFILNPADTANYSLNGGGGSGYLIEDVSVIPSEALPNAGNDTIIYQGDSTFLGPNEISLPYVWFVKGSTEPIDSGGGMWVHPDSTTTYVLQQTLCGEVTFDTVTVTVKPVSVGNVNLANISVYPNPATDEVTIANAPQGSEVKIFNIVGQQVFEAAIKNSRQIFDVSNLPDGNYIMQIDDVQTGEKITRRFVIENKY